ncbi:hypothetical protein BDP27DRAFT_236732 [Rhodocollybia butyracea]|uniref:Uncharacterized protein n=1 Tax=Rhodocollybia butyracea TaxID=206335 RepID=A0A9P5PHT3_9AGAR|nr:hypothetical protein BDP27DRAFT_236732 [Rhodocollybia butyracea]
MHCSSTNDPKIWLLVGLILVFISFTWTIANVALVGSLSAINVGCDARVTGLIGSCPHVLDSKVLDGPFLTNVEGIPITITLLVSDMIVVWRAWILLSRNCFWKNTLVSLAIINTVVNIIDCIANPIFNIMATNGFEPDTTSGNLIINYSGILDLVSILTSLLVNAVATILIGWKAWYAYICCFYLHSLFSRL